MLSQKGAKTFASWVENKILQPKYLRSFSETKKGEGKTIATLNGSFDLLHAGHLEMLYQASLQADLLVVLLNSDASIRAYKNPNRPINPLEDRLQNMAALAMVDFVSWFEETDPRRVLDELRPNVHINGGEYGVDCIEAEVVKKHGGRIHIVDLVEGRSTTNLLERIRATCD